MSLNLLLINFRNKSLTLAKCCRCTTHYKNDDQRIPFGCHIYTRVEGENETAVKGTTVVDSITLLLSLSSTFVTDRCQS